MKYLPSIFKRQNANEDHQAVIDALTNAMTDIKTDTDVLQQELVITTSSGQWLDQWADWFGVKRKLNETDEALQTRVLEVLQQKRLTIPAIIELVKKILGEDTIVTIYEPFTDIRRFNVSTFSEKGRFQDGYYYRIGVVDIGTSKPVTSELIQLLNLIKAAGTKLIIHQV